MSNPLSSNHLEDPLLPPDPQGDSGDPWDTIPIAVRRSFKAKFKDAAKKVGLKPSQYGRMLLHDGVARTQQAA